MNKDKFLALLMGECWHEVIDYEIVPYGRFICQNCHLPAHKCNNPDYLNNPLPVIRWMEENMPEVWEKYLEWCVRCFFPWTDRDTQNYLNTILFRQQLNLSNLVAYLKEHREEWEVKECRVCQGTGEGEVNKCRYCNGTGKIKHPALVYLESEEATDAEKG